MILLLASVQLIARLSVNDSQSGDSLPTTCSGTRGPAEATRMPKQAERSVTATSFASHRIPIVQSTNDLQNLRCLGAKAIMEPETLVLAKNLCLTLEGHVLHNRNTTVQIANSTCPSDPHLTVNKRCKALEPAGS